MMENVKIARKIILGYLNYIPMEMEDKLAEIATVNVDDEYLLEHINMILEVLNKAKKELEVDDE